MLKLNLSLIAIIALFISMSSISITLASEQQQAEDFCAKAKKNIQEMRENGFKEEHIALGLTGSHDKVVERTLELKLHYGDLFNENSEFFDPMEDLINNAAACRRVTPNWSHWMKAALKQTSSRSAKKRNATAELILDGDFRLSSNELAYVFLSTPALTINGDGCSVKLPGMEKRQMNIDAKGNISYNDPDWSITGWQGAGASTLEWQFNANGMGNCSGSWRGSGTMIDASNSTYDDITNSVYGIAPINGIMYLFPMKVMPGAASLDITLDGSISLDWLTPEIAQQAGMTLGQVDLSTEPKTVRFPELRFENYSANSTSVFDVVMNVNLQTNPVSFTLISAAPLP